MSINVEIARRTLDQIRFHPETHNQDQWMIILDPLAETLEACGTTACVAGHAANLAGLLTYRRGPYGWFVQPEDDDWIGAGVKALGLEDYTDSVERFYVLIPVPGKEAGSDVSGCDCCPEDRGDEGVSLFCSNASREDVIAALEWLVKTGEEQEARG